MAGNSTPGSTTGATPLGTPRTIYYLSQLIGQTVLDPEDRPVGRLDDLVARLSGAYPPVNGLTLRLGGIGPGIGPRATFLPWSQVAAVSAAGLRLSSARLDLLTFRRRPGELLLKTDLLDQQVMDLDGRKLVRVNDVQLVSAGVGGADLRLAGIDVGVRGLLRRLGVHRAADWLAYRLARQVPDRVIPWDDVEPVDLSELPADQANGAAARPAAGRGLRLAHDKLAALHPADVAELVAQLAAPERATVLESLDVETAAEALGELDPDMQGDVLESLPTATAVELLAELPPDEAADALAEVSEARADELLGRLDAAEAEAVRELMAYPEDTAGSLMTNAYVALPAHLTAQETIETLRRLAPPAEEVYYIYVIDAAERLSGVLSLRDLIVAPPTTRLAEIIADHPGVVHVPASAARDEVVEAIDKYNLLALPVTDEAERLVGVITVDDALAALLPSGGRRRLAGVHG